MTLLWINLAIVFCFALFARYFSIPVFASNVNMPAFVKPNKLLILISMGTLIIISGLRANIGDTFFYKHTYQINVIDWEFIASQKDYGFGILQMLLKNYISENPQTLIFTTALITNTLIVIVLYKYSRLIDISLFVYITGGLFLVSMNGIRQMLAAAIFFTAISFLIKGKFIPYALIVFIASFFHQSALILLPIYFIVRFKAWSRATIILLVIAVVIVIGFEQFSRLLFSAIDSTQYSVYQDFQEGGANIIRVVVFATPLVIAYLGREKLRAIFPESDYIVNMALIGFMFMVIATQNWIFARFSLYFELYQLILISWVIKVFREKDQKIIYFAILICYFLYYFYESVITLNIHYRSDYLIL